MALMILYIEMRVADITCDELKKKFKKMCVLEECCC